MTHKSQGRESSDHNNDNFSNNNDNFSNFNKYDRENYKRDSRAPKWLTSDSHQKRVFLLSMV